MDIFNTRDCSQSVDPHIVADSCGNGALSVYHSTKIKFLHRTAQDFVLNTEEGRKIIGRQEDLVMQRFRATMRARIGALVQVVEAFDCESVEAIMRALHDYRKQYELEHEKDLESEYDTGYEIELLVTLSQVCQHISVSGNSERLFGYTNFWGLHSYQTFETNAARYGFLHYIQLFVRNQGSYIGPYYLGYLALWATQGANSDLRDNLGLVSWLVRNGADIHTAHRVRGEDVIPASGILESIFYSWGIYAMQTLQSLLSYIEKPFCAVHIIHHRGDTWRFGGFDSWKLPLHLFSGQIMVRMSINKLCFLVMHFIEVTMNIQPQW